MVTSSNDEEGDGTTKALMHGSVHALLEAGERLRLPQASK
jgi:hypothetical protein